MTVPDDRVSAYLDGELTPRERAEVEALLAADPAWRADAESLAAVRDAARALAVAEPPDGFWAEMVAAVRADEESSLRSGATASPARRRARHPLRWVGAGVAASVLLFAAALAVPHERDVKPSIDAYAEAHSARAGATADPLSPVAPAVVQAGLHR